MHTRVIFENYNFGQKDAELLKNAKHLLIQKKEDFLDAFYAFIFSFEHAKRFIHSDEILHKHREAIGHWYDMLFCGVYNEAYLASLYRISETHVSIGLPAHYVNAAFSFVRRFVRNVALSEGRIDILDPLDKIVDINLDILTTTYQQEEQNKLIEDVLFVRNCARANTITPYAQGIFCAKTLKPHKYECLMRLVAPENPKDVRSVYPYLSVAKSMKLYPALMREMLQKSFEFFCGKSHDFSINVSYEDISDKNFVDEIFGLVLTCKAASRLIFEIVETDFISDFSIVESFALRAREHGCSIAIDDFGSGFSNMKNILSLKPEFIKIDGSLIRNLDSSNESEIIVKNIVNMAKDLGIQTVAEYIHNQVILEKAQALQVDYLQGFHLAKPTPLKMLLTEKS